MERRKIVIACDHHGFALKEYLVSLKFIDWIDVGACTQERSDYPIFAHKAITTMQKISYTAAILLCGTGNGMAIAANRFKGIFACVVWNAEIATRAKEEDNCNVLVIPADYVSQHNVDIILSCWLNATFKKGRYAQRCALIESLS